MSRFIDLDAVVSPDIKVQLGGETYLIPGSPDVPRMLKWMSWSNRFDSDDAQESVSLLEEVYDDLLDLFRIRQPDLEALPIHQEQIEELFAALFAQASEVADPPTKTPRSARSRKS